MPNHNPHNQFKSRTPEEDKAIELQMDAISKMTTAQEVESFLEKCNHERDDIRERRRVDCRREDEIDIFEDAALAKLKQLQTSAINDVKDANQALESARKVVIFNFKM